MPYGFRPFTHADLGRAAAWLRTPEAVRWWGEPDEQLALLAEDLGSPLMRQWIVEHGRRPFAYVQAYPAHAWPAPHLAHLPEWSEAIDAFIGEPDMLGIGHGGRFLRQFAQMLVDAGAPVVAIDPDVDNWRARRAYARAGFVGDEIVETGEGPAALMLFQPGLEPAAPGRTSVKGSAMQAEDGRRTTSTMQVRAAYGHWAETYDTAADATRDLDATVLRAAALPLAGQAVIEIGAGTGKNTAYLAAHAREVLAMDLSPAMLALALARVPDRHVRFVEHDITQPWPAPDGGVEIVVGNLVLEHVADLRPVLAEAYRALRPGGTLFLVELHPYRQLAGAQARFDTPDGPVLVEAYSHTVPTYVNTALQAGFTLLRLDEWSDPAAGGGSAAPGIPRLLSLRFQR